MSRTANDSTERFGSRADDYARARPRYPAQVVTALAGALALAPGATVVDLGCGTGLSCEPFLAAGYRVLGVEPNRAMREHALERARNHASFTVLDGRAEATGLAAGSADLVVAAQAFHWFDVAATRLEALRILRRPALAALIWNDRRETGSAFAEGYEALMRSHSPDYLEIRHRHHRRERVDAFFGHADWHTANVTHADALDLATLEARMASASYLPAPGDPRHAALLHDLRALFDATARDGRVLMEYDTRALHGTLAP